MKTNNRLLLIFLIICSLLTFINVFIFFKKRNNYDLQNKAQAKLKSAKEAKDLEFYYLKLGIKYDEIPLNKSIPFTDSVQKYSALNFIQKRIVKPTLVFRYSDITCTPCVDSSIKVLNTLSPEISRDDILLFASYDNSRDFLVWKRMNHIKYSVIQIPKTESILKGVDNLNVPYFFLLLPGDYTIHQLFFPMKENVDRTKQYLDAIIDRYFAKM